MADDGTILGLGPDLEQKKFDLDRFENALNTAIINSIGSVPAARCKTRFEEIDSHTVCLVDVTAATKPTFATTDKGAGLFFIRQANTTRLLDTKETVDYVADRFGLS